MNQVSYNINIQQQLLKFCPLTINFMNRKIKNNNIHSIIKYKKKVNNKLNKGGKSISH